MNTETPLIKIKLKVIMSKASASRNVSERKGVKRMEVTRATQTVGRVGTGHHITSSTYESLEVIKALPHCLVQDLKKEGREEQLEGRPVKVMTRTFITT